MAFLPPGFGLDPEAEYRGFEDTPVRWKTVWKTDALPFASVSARDGLWAVAYACTRVYSPEQRDAALVIGGNVPGLLGWVNRRIWVYQPNVEAARETVGVSQGGFVLREGWNTLLFKVLQRHDTRLTLRLVHGRERNRIIDDLRYALPE